jgi:hypothetical protein
MPVLHLHWSRNPKLVRETTLGITVCGQKVPRAQLTAHLLDDAKAMTLLTTNRFAEREPWYAKRVRQQCLDQARGLIRKHRAAVEAVANALLAKETLTAGEIDQMMMDAEAWRRVTR